jgi:hypothetical protein
VKDAVRQRPENRGLTTAANEIRESDNMIARLAHLAVDATCKPLLGRIFPGHPMQRKGCVLPSRLPEVPISDAD